MTAKKTEVQEDRSEIDILEPGVATDRVELEDGTELLLNRMKTRELFKLLRILTHGAGHILGSINLQGEDFIQQLSMVLVLAIPDAEDETIDFIRAMVEPLGIDHSRRLTKSAKEANEALYDELDVRLENPDLDDLLTIITGIIRNEGPELQSLGKKLLTILETVSPDN